MMELTFTEAAKGVNKELSVNIDDNCPRCGGIGNEPGTKVSLCHYCNGTGMVSFSRMQVNTGSLVVMASENICLSSSCRRRSAPAHS